MKPTAGIALRLAPGRALAASRSAAAAAAAFPRHIHGTSTAPANVAPIHGSGPPPEPPVPSADSPAQRVSRRRRQAELLRRAQDIRAAQAAHRSKPSGQEASKPLLRRFWKDVHVKEVDGAWEVHLDARPLRHPTTKKIVRLPLSKPLLADALAIEWDMLVSAQEATRYHLIPLTSLVCRATDIAEDDAAGSPAGIRQSVARMVMRYLDTDSLLCWAPPPQKHDLVPGQETLRDIQKRTTEEIVGFLTGRVWPGIEIVPVLDGESIMPKKQSAITRQIIEGWVMGLDVWELAGLERGVLAGKSLLGAVRLLVEWSEGPVGAGIGDGASGGEKQFDIERAAKAASLEVDWQISNWGEVEDTHDVEKEDIRRQLGSVILLVTGAGRQ